MNKEPGDLGDLGDGPIADIMAAFARLDAAEEKEAEKAAIAAVEAYKTKNPEPPRVNSAGLAEALAAIEAQDAADQAAAAEYYESLSLAGSKPPPRAKPEGLAEAEDTINKKLGISEASAREAARRILKEKNDRREYGFNSVQYSSAETAIEEIHGRFQQIVFEGRDMTKDQIFGLIAGEPGFPDDIRFIELEMLKLNTKSVFVRDTDALLFGAFARTVLGLNLPVFMAQMTAGNETVWVEQVGNEFKLADREKTGIPDALVLYNGIAHYDALRWNPRRQSYTFVRIAPDGNCFWHSIKYVVDVVQGREPNIDARGRVAGALDMKAEMANWSTTFQRIEEKDVTLLKVEAAWIDLTDLLFENARILLGKDQRSKAERDRKLQERAIFLEQVGSVADNEGNIVYNWTTGTALRGQSSTRTVFRF